MSKTEATFPGQFFSLRIRAWDLLTACGAVLSGATVLAFFGSVWWFLDLFSHFRVQYFLGLSFIAIVLVFRRQYKAPATFGILALVNLGTILPLYFGVQPGTAVTSRPYRALLMNVNTQSGQPNRVAQVIRELAPDIVALEEVNDNWLSALSDTLTGYPYSQTMPREDNFGIAVYSKHPLVEAEVRQIGEAEVPSVVAELELPDGRITLIATHPLPPAGAENWRLRNEQLARLAEVAKNASSPMLLLGDLNATPWDPHFKQLLTQSGLTDASKGRGVLGTWPVSFPILLIPIDHCLHSPGIQVTGRATGPNIGSDHYPLVIDFIRSEEAVKRDVSNGVTGGADKFSAKHE